VAGRRRDRTQLLGHDAADRQRGAGAVCRRLGVAPDQVDGLRGDAELVAHPPGQRPVLADGLGDRGLVVRDPVQRGVEPGHLAEEQVGVLPDRLRVAGHLAGGVADPVGQLFDLVGDHAEPAAGLAGPDRLDVGVEHDDVGLARDLGDQRERPADPVDRLQQADQALPRVPGAHPALVGLVPHGSGRAGHLGDRRQAAADLVGESVDGVGEATAGGGGGLGLRTDQRHVAEQFVTGHFRRHRHGRPAVRPAALHRHREAVRRQGELAAGGDGDAGAFGLALGGQGQHPRGALVQPLVPGGHVGPGGRVEHRHRVAPQPPAERAPVLGEHTVRRRQVSAGLDGLEQAVGPPAVLGQHRRDEFVGDAAVRGCHRLSSWPAW
jgi:hypothetical protein